MRDLEGSGAKGEEICSEWSRTSEERKQVMVFFCVMEWVSTREERTCCGDGSQPLDFLKVDCQCTYQGYLGQQTHV